MFIALTGRILRAPVDLLFNGGIGLSKAESESGCCRRSRQRSVRVNADQVRAGGEGGNLGVTALGRVGS